MNITNVICAKCGKVEEYNKAQSEGWLIASLPDKPGYMVIRCQVHITDHARRLAGMQQKYQVGKTEITHRLGGLGATWAMKSTKHADNLYHIMPDKSQPWVNSEKTFKSLADIDEWLSTWEKAKALSDAGDEASAEDTWNDYYELLDLK